MYRFDQKDANLIWRRTGHRHSPPPARLAAFQKRAFVYPRPVHRNEVDGTKNIPFIPAARLFTDVAVSLLPKGKTLRNLHIEPGK